MRKSIFSIILTAVLLSACNSTPEGYAAVHQVISDPLILYLGNSYYLAKERDGEFLLIRIDQNNEVAEMKKIF